MKLSRAAFVVVAGLVVGCVGLICPIDSNSADPELQKFASPEELRAFLVDQARRQSGGRSGGGAVFFTDDVDLAAPTAGGDGSGVAESDAANNSDFSTTNIQEEGVDESDIVKNDGNTIFVLEDRTIHVVQAWPVEEVQELATVELDLAGDSLYLRDDSLIALSRNQLFYYFFDDVVGFGGAADVLPGMAVSEPASKVDEAAQSFAPGPFDDGNETAVTIIDVSDPANPAVAHTLRFEGNLVSSRLIDNRLYLIMTTTPAVPFNVTDEELEQRTLEEWLPDFTVTGPDGETTGDLVDWTGFYRPVAPDGFSMTLVVTIDVDDPSAAFETTAIVAGAGTIYASTEALYVTDTSYDFESFSSRTDTAIHKLAFVEQGTQYVASGSVPGRVLNQYSLGEYQGNLRIATTTENTDGESFTESNNVYVLGENGTALDILGQIEGIAPGERIYSARFIGERGFLVTFVRVDPLFTLDLSNPANPTILGELKVPGFSDHIQLLDENHLLTIGRDTVDAGDFAWIQGVQLSIFDVTDPTSPQLDHKVVIGGRGSYSEANYNPKAFNHFPERSVLALPIDLYEEAGSDSAFGGHHFTGLYVFNVTAEAGFDLLGRISSSREETPSDCFYGYYGFTRGVFIDDNVYSVTAESVRTASLSDLSTLTADISFANAPTPITDCSFPIAEPDIFLPEGEGLR